MTYKVQEQLKPRSLTGLSAGQIEQHWQLKDGRDRPVRVASYAAGLGVSSLPRHRRP